MYDEKKKIFIAGRDPLGKKPLYYLNNEEEWYFSSECKSFLDIDRSLKNVCELEAGQIFSPSDLNNKSPS